MTTMISTEQTAVLKSDTRGRVRTPPERRERLLDEFERSGLSGAKFAEVVGIKYQTLAAWVTKRRKQRGVARTAANAADPVRWLEAVVREAQAPACHPGAAVKLRLGTGICIEVSDVSQVSLAVHLVHALDKSAAPC